MEQEYGAKFRSKIQEQIQEQNSGAKLGARIGANPQTVSYPNKHFCGGGGVLCIFSY